MEDTTKVSQTATGSATTGETRDKEAWAQVLVWLWRLVKYGPMIYRAVKKIIEYTHGSSAPAQVAPAHEAGFEETKDEVFRTLSSVVDTIEGIIGAGSEALNGPWADLVVTLLEVFGLDKTQMDAFKAELQKVLVAIDDFLKQIQSGLSLDEKPGEGQQDYAMGENEYSVARAAIDRVVEGDYIQINSGLYGIRRGSSYYSEIESLMEKVAQQNNINDVSEIEIQISKEGMVACFRENRVAVDINLGSGAAAGAVSKFNDMIPGSQAKPTGMLEAAMMGGIGSLTNFGFAAGMGLAKYFGAGTLMQLAAGGIGALIWSFVFSGNKETTNEAYQKAMEDPEMAKGLNQYALEHKTTTEEAFPAYIKSLKAQLDQFGG
jgi:hypothetical protein